MPNTKPPITFSAALAEYKDWEGGGGNSLLPFNGYTFVKVVELESVESKSSPNQNAKITMVVLDDAPWSGINPKGMQLIKDIPYTGKRSDGKMNADTGFASFLRSSGTSMDKLAKLVGQTMDIDAVFGTIKGRTCWVEVESKEYNGKVTSDLKNFVIEEVYNKQKKAGTHRKDLPAAHRAFLPGMAAETTAPPSNGASSDVAPSAAAEDKAAAAAL